MPPTPTVFVIDDEPDSLRAICIMLESTGWPVAGFHSASEFLRQYCHDQPGCLVVDLRMPEIDGVELVGRLGEKGVALPTIIVTGNGDIASCARAFKAGVFDFFEKPLCEPEFLARVQDALAEDARRRQPQSRANVQELLARLTPREREILDLLVDGRSLKQIAGVCAISVQTAWKHRAAILEKIGVENEVALVRLLLGS